MKRKYFTKMLGLLLCAGMLGMTGCAGNDGKNGQGDRGQQEKIQIPSADRSDDNKVSNETEITEEKENAMMEKDYAQMFKELKLTKSLKGVKDENPIYTQRFGADPYALVYEDRVYFYMTQDSFMTEADGTIKENNYQNIKTISVISTDDFVNFTDHGEIPVAGKDGVATWANNSWAPAAAWKMIDGKPKFFLYFADAGGGIGVISADSPVGPFKDELGKGLIRRDMPNCGNVLWLFDPAVLVDDDGKAYIYFGGGVPKDKIDWPGTGRVAQLGDDMMSIVGEPVALDVPYLFEDSGIHKYKDTYYYTYCSNWQVDEAGTEKYGFVNAEIVCLESKSPMGPFTFKEVILENPGKNFGLYGNNHHAVFSFKDQWYITYHTRVQEKKMGVEKGYRCVHIDEFEMGEDGTIGKIEQTLTGRKQIKSFDLYQETSAATMAVCAGVNTRPADEVGKMVLTEISDGDFVKLEGVDFSDTSAKTLRAKIKTNSQTGVIRISTDMLNGDVIGYLPVEGSDEGFVWMETGLTQEITGVHDVYFTFCGEGYEIESWQLVK